jgi:archaeal type IV pilus assembly protein PilA
MSTKRTVKNDAVSPVVGVMLMLVVTIIIAAVVSAYAGGLTTGQKKAPTASVEMHMMNDGTSNSYFSIKVLSVSEPIQTRDLKLVTSWVNQSGGRGGATVTGNGQSMNTHHISYTPPTYSAGSLKSYNAPIGYGPGVMNYTNTAPYNTSQWWGNISWMSGTTMINWPGNYGIPQYEFYPIWAEYIGREGNQVDSLTAILGLYWNTLRPGDTLNVKVLHIPSGKIIVDQNVRVEG